MHNNIFILRRYNLSRLRYTLYKDVGYTYLYDFLKFVIIYVDYMILKESGRGWPIIHIVTKLKQHEILTLIYLDKNVCVENENSKNCSLSGTSVIFILFFLSLGNNRGCEKVPGYISLILQDILFMDILKFWIKGRIRSAPAGIISYPMGHSPK